MKVEITLTDQRAGAAATKRTVTMVVADMMNGQIRSQVVAAGINSVVPLNIDVHPEVLADAKIRLNVGLQYDWPAPLDQPDRPPRGTVMTATMHDNVTLILENGKPMVAAQSADPIGDRQVTLEVKATVLK